MEDLFEEFAVGLLETCNLSGVRNGMDPAELPQFRAARKYLQKRLIDFHADYALKRQYGQHGFKRICVRPPGIRIIRMSELFRDDFIPVKVFVEQAKKLGYIACFGLGYLCVSFP